jgi:hypothetical protein
MARFVIIEGGHVSYAFNFFNHTKHHPVNWKIGPMTDGTFDFHGTVKAGDIRTSDVFPFERIRKSNVQIIKLGDVPAPGFQFRVRGDKQYIKPLAGHGYTVTHDNDHFSEVVGNGYRVTVDGGGIKNPTTSAIFIQVYPHHKDNEPDDGHTHHWHEVHGKHSYCHCACSSHGNNKEKHDFHHTMHVKKGAPFLHATLTKNNHSIDFPDGAKLTVEGPGGTKYDHHIKEKDKLVVMHGSSVRCLIIKHPKPGDWKLTVTAHKGVKFHCECSTVPSKDVYDTITNTLSNSLEEMAVTQEDPVVLGGPVVLGWIGILLLATILDKLESLTDVSSKWTAASLDLDSFPVSGESGGTKNIHLSPGEQIQAGKAAGKAIKQKQKTGGIKEAAQLAKGIAFSQSKKKKKDKPYALLTWNFQGANWNNPGLWPWHKVAEWFRKGYSDEENDFPYRIQVGCFQECGALPAGATAFGDPIEIGDGVTLEEYFWDIGSDRHPLFLYILFYKWDRRGNRVNLAVISPAGIHNHSFLPGHLRPLIGLQQGGTYFYTIHGASGGGSDVWALLRDLADRHTHAPWWVAGDYNQEPGELRQKLTNHGINLTVCPPDHNTHPSNDPRRKLDYATRNESAQRKTGDVFFRDVPLFSDHLAVFYVL